MFDFFLFGFYASHIAHAFFPSDNEITSLLFTFMTFGAGFLMRPLGAIVLGAYVDRVGRRLGLIVTLSIMAMGHDPDRVRAELRHHWRARSIPRAHRQAAAGFPGGRRVGRGVGLSFRDGPALAEGVPCRLAGSKLQSSSRRRSATCSTSCSPRPSSAIGVLAYSILRGLPDR